VDGLAIAHLGNGLIEPSHHVLDLGGKEQHPLPEPPEAGSLPLAVPAIPDLEPAPIRAGHPLPARERPPAEARCYGRRAG
jgi:hypothetical protein